MLNAHPHLAATPPRHAPALILVALLSSLFCTTVQAALPGVCDPSKAKVGDLCTTSAALIHPTQLILGYQEVRMKADRFSAMKSGDFHDYLESNPVPAVLGPKGVFYALDHHHLTAAVMTSTLSTKDQVVVVQVKDTSLAGIAETSDFWKSMVQNKWVWLYDEKGNYPVNPVLLPPLMTSLANDPYRSLAYNVRKAGGYKKVLVDYQDFLWVNFFRQHKLFPTSATSPDKFCAAAPYSLYCFGGVKEEDAAIAAVQDQAMALARSSAASSLPGYVGSSVGVPMEDNAGAASAMTNGDGAQTSTGVSIVVIASVACVAAVGLVVAAVITSRRWKRGQPKPVQSPTTPLFQMPAVAVSVREQAADTAYGSSSNV